VPRGVVLAEFRFPLVVCSSLTGGIMRRRLSLSAILWAGLLAASPANAASITFSTVTNGNLVEVGVSVTDAPDLFGFEFALGFDPNLVAFREVTGGTDLGSVFALFSPVQLDQNGDPIVDDDGGLLPVPGFSPVTIAGLVFDPTGVQSGLLATLIFETLGSFSGSFAILTASLLDSLDNPIPVDIVPPDTTSVPEPSTLGLLGIGLAVLARHRLRRNPQRSA
jgi:PEP-CTERM motif